MASCAAPSLMDDVEFLAELEAMERTSSLDAASAPPPRGTVEDLESEEGDEPFEAAIANRWAIDGLDEATSSDRSVRDFALAAIGFVVMMAVGAAGAAFVFHARLAVLLR